MAYIRMITYLTVICKHTFEFQNTNKNELIQYSFTLAQKWEHKFCVRLPYFFFHHQKNIFMEVPQCKVIFYLNKSLIIWLHLSVHEFFSSTQHQVILAFLPGKHFTKSTQHLFTWSSRHVFYKYNYDIPLHNVNDHMRLTKNDWGLREMWGCLKIERSLKKMEVFSMLPLTRKLIRNHSNLLYHGNMLWVHVIFHFQQHWDSDITIVI